MSSAETGFARASPVEVTATITNRSERAISVPNGAPWVNGEFRFGLEVAVGDGAGVSFGPIVPPAPGVIPQEKHFSRLAPGESVRIAFAIGDFVPGGRDVSKGSGLAQRPGEYVVRARSVSKERGYLMPSRRGPEMKVIDDMWLGETPWAGVKVTIQ